MCSSVMQLGGAANPTVPNTLGEDPYYVRCYDAYNPNPLNGIRAAFVSQTGTTNIDPELPQVDSIYNVTACLRVFAFGIIK